MLKQSPILKNANSLAMTPKTCLFKNILQTHGVAVASNRRVRGVSTGDCVSNYQS